MATMSLNVVDLGMNDIWKPKPKNGDAINPESQWPKFDTSGETQATKKS